MKKYYNLVLISILAGLLLIPATGMADANNRPTIGVYRIEADDYQISQILTESLSADLAKMKSCYVVERDKLDQVFSEQALSYDGIVEALNGGSGQAIGLDYLLIGSSSSTVTRKYNHKYKSVSYYTKIAINLKLVDARNQIGRVVWSGQRSIDNINQTGDLTDDALEIAYDMCRQIYEQEFPLTGYVIKIANGNYYLDVGTDDGVAVKDKLTVENTSGTIIHPVTGEMIATGGTTGTLKVIETHDNYSIAVLDGNADSKIYVKDRVIKKIKKKPKDWSGLLWSGKVEF